MAVISKKFQGEALGLPDLSDGSWRVQDVAGKGLMQAIQAATAPQAEKTLTAGAKPAPFAP